MILPLSVPVALAMMYASDIVPVVFTVSAGLFVTGLCWFPGYTGLRFRQGAAALLGCALLCAYRAHEHMTSLAFAMEHQMAQMRLRPESSPELSAMLAGGLVFFLAALALRLWGRWVGEKATAEEREPGLPGVRAWFCTSNVAVGALIVICAWQGDDVSPVLSIAGVGALLAAWPLLKMQAPASPVSAVASVQEDVSAGREKIVAMLEAGKLTAEESAGLLQALGATKRAAPLPVTVALTGGQRLMLIGAAVVMAGFFLPWFVINPGAEMERMMGGAQQFLQDQIGNLHVPGGMNLPQGTPMPGMSFKTSSLSVSGGDIGHGLGWAALLLALAAALLPYVATTLEAAAARMARSVCLGIGALVMLYLLSEGVRHAGIGLIIAMAGYGMLIAGLLPDWRKKVA